MAYATVAELRAHIDKVTTGDDAALLAMLEAATANIDRAINQFRPGYEYFNANPIADARTYPGSGLQYQRIDHCIEITLVAVKDAVTDSTYTSWAPADWIAYSGSHTRPNFNDLPYTGIMIAPGGDYSWFTSGRYGSKKFFFAPSMDQQLSPHFQQGRMTPTVQVTAKWGYSDSPPADIREACIMQAARWYKRLQSSMADVLASGELGQLLYQKSLDPDIKRILVDGRYMRPALGIL